MEATTRFQPGQFERMGQGQCHGSLERTYAGINPEFFLWAAGFSVLASALTQATGKKEESNFIGHWAPTFLLLGIYSKLDRMSRRR